MKHDDSYIVELFWTRSEQAISETQTKYGKYCFSIAKSILGNDEDAKECVNDTYLGAWNSIPPHKPSCLSTFLGKLTRRIAADRVRARNADKRGGGELTLVLDELEECLPSTDSVEGQLLSDLLSRVINDFLGTLTREERQVFLGRYWYARSLREISGQMGFSESKVKSMLFRLRNRLKKTLEKEELYEKL